MSERPTVGAGGKIRVGVVGAGEFGRNHARVYREMERVELTGVLDQNAARGEAIAQEFGIRAFKSMEELQGAVDAASVAVPTVAHAEVGCRLIAMGIDVLVEKPMAASLAEADALLESARRHQRILQVGHVERFNPAVMTAMSLISEPVHVRGVRHSPYAPRIRTKSNRSDWIGSS